MVREGLLLYVCLNEYTVRAFAALATMPLQQSEVRKRPLPLTFMGKLVIGKLMARRSQGRTVLEPGH